jgi:hypothetical protein
MAFALVVFAIGVITSATVGYKLSAQRMGSDAFGVWVPIAVFALLAPLLFVGPLLLFTARLLDEKQRGLVRLGLLGVTYTRHLWHYTNAEIPSRADLAELADAIGGSTSLATAYEHVVHMRIVPFDLQSLLRFTASAVTPFLPLLLRYTDLPADVVAVVKGFLGGSGGGESP